MTQNLRVQGTLSAEDSNFTGTDLNMLFGNTTQESQVATAGLEAFGALVTRFYSGGSLYGEGLGIWNSVASVAPGSAGNFYSLVYYGDSGQFSSNLLSFRYNSYPIRCVKNKDDLKM